MAERLDGDPLAILHRWAAEAAEATQLPTLMTLATADGDGAPHARTVAVTAVDGSGVRFHSSTPTTKTRDLAARPRATGVFLWPTLGRQVVLEGAVAEQPAEVSRAAYPTRPRQLQLLAWVYEDLGQHLREPLAQVPGERIAERMAAAAERDPRTLPMPQSWTTFVVVPTRVDYWQAGTELLAPIKTRFLRAGTTPQDLWERRETLP